MMQPPPAKPERSRRFAVTLNLILPGAGQIYLGRWKLGAGFLLLFAACFISLVVIFLVGAARYFDLTTNGNILEGDKLEQLSTVYHPRWLIGLSLAGAGIWAASLIELARNDQRTELPSAPPRER